MTDSQLEPSKEFQKEIGKISRQTFIHLLGTVFVLFGGYLFKIYIVRILGASGIGLFAMGMSVVSVFQLFSTMGIPGAMVRYIPMFAAEKAYRRIISLHNQSNLIVISITVLFAILLYSISGTIANSVFRAYELKPVLEFLALLIPLGGVNQLYFNKLVGFQKTAHAKSVNSFISFPVLVLFTLIFFQAGWGLKGYIAANVLSVAVSVIVMAGFTRNIVRGFVQKGPTVVHPASGLSSNVFVFGLYIAGIGIMDYASGRFDHILLGFFLTPDKVGIYNTALRVTDFIPTVLVAVNSIFSPMISGLYSSGKVDVLEDLLQTLNKWVTALTLPLFGFVLIFSTELLAVFGKEFVFGRWVLILFGIAQMINVGTGSTGYMLLMAGYQQRVIIIKTFFAFASPAVCIFLIPSMGILGAAVAGLITLSSQSVAFVILVRIHLKMLPYNRFFWKIFPPFLISLLLIGIVKKMVLFRVSFSFWIVLLSGLIGMYFVYGILYLLMAFDHNDRMIKQTISKRVGLILFRLKSKRHVK